MEERPRSIFGPGLIAALILVLIAVAIGFLPVVTCPGCSGRGISSPTLSNLMICDCCKGKCRISLLTRWRGPRDPAQWREQAFPFALPESPKGGAGRP